MRVDIDPNLSDEDAAATFVHEIGHVRDYRSTGGPKTIDIEGRLEGEKTANAPAFRHIKERITQTFNLKAPPLAAPAWIELYDTWLLGQEGLPGPTGRTYDQLVRENWSYSEPRVVPASFCLKNGPGGGRLPLLRVVGDEVVRQTSN